jgi:uncharacterized membrane protein YadS
MATAIAIERKPDGLGQVLGLLPGIALLAAIGLTAKWIEQSINGYTKANHIVFPNIEYVLWAIVIGLLIGNLIKLPAIFNSGIDTYEFWLKTGIVLLGSRISRSWAASACCWCLWRLAGRCC